uniref:NET domain-containing protein n=1 Tax=Musa acuminata subsp. malaccensis TaxID=214687 RepID=A0A804JJF3_MUSAM|nr:PREDICTED: bromodomain-containing protein 4 isoform X3 [Musa acuminata subsp. malaccensis]
MMPESSSVTQNELGPDYFGYFKHLFFELFPQSGDRASPSLPSNLESLLGYPSGQVEGIVSPNNVVEDKSCYHSASFFTRVIGEELSEYKKERLKAILHHATVCLNQEADEVFGCILTTLLIELDLQDKRQLSCHSSFSNEEICEPLCNKKRKSSSLDNFGGFSNPFGVNTQFRTKLMEMEENIDEYLDMVVSKCRPMTNAEKQQLGRRIQKLPGEALGGVVDIFRQRNSPATDFPDDVFVNLDELDNVTLWRLYFHVQAVVKSKEL